MHFAHILFPVCIPDGGIQCIQYFFLVGAPERRNQECLRAVSGEAVDDHFSGKNLQTGKDDPAVFFKAEDVEGRFLIFLCKLGTPEHMEKLEFDAVCADAVRTGRCSEAVSDGCL
jgi:hypothetical protein